MIGNGFYNAYTCDACQCHLTLVKLYPGQEIMGHDVNCKVKGLG